MSSSPPISRRLLLGCNCASPLVFLGLLHCGCPWAALAVLAIGHAFIAFAIFAPDCQWLGHVHTRFETQAPEVWLTIDDGPDPRDTPRLLDILKKNGAKATFFVIGKKARQHPELCREILAQGHQIGNHTFSHPAAWQWLYPPKAIRREVEAGAAAVMEISGESNPLFRPPAGHKNIFLNWYLREPIVGWTARGFDASRRNAMLAIQRISTALAPGVIILMHEGGNDLPDGTRLAPALLQGILDELQRQGLNTALPKRDALR